MSRWENLQQEIADEFAQEHPLCNTNPPALIYEMHRKQQLVYFERTGPRQKPRGKVGKRPVVMPAQPTKYQRSYIRRRGMREKLPDTRPGVTHHFEIFD